MSLKLIVDAVITYIGASNTTIFDRINPSFYKNQTQRVPPPTPTTSKTVHRLMSMGSCLPHQLFTHHTKSATTNLYPTLGYR